MFQFLPAGGNFLLSRSKFLQWAVIGSRWVKPGQNWSVQDAGPPLGQEYQVSLLELHCNQPSINFYEIRIDPYIQLIAFRASLLACCSSSKLVVSTSWLTTGSSRFDPKSHHVSYKICLTSLQWFEINMLPCFHLLQCVAEPLVFKVIWLNC